MIIWLILAVIAMYMEAVYHVSCYGFSMVSPFLPITILLIFISVEYLLICLTKGKLRSLLFWGGRVTQYLLFAIQAVYFTVFKQPLQLQTMVRGGQDAFNSYWREILVAIGKTSPGLVLLFLPIVVLIVLVRKKKISVQNITGLQRVRAFFALGVSGLLFYVVLNVGKYTEADFYQEYAEYYAPLSVAEKMGLVTMVQRDCFFEIESLFEDDSLLVMSGGEKMEMPVIATPMPIPTPTHAHTEVVEPTEEPNVEETLPDVTPTPAPLSHSFELDVNKLLEVSRGDKQKEWLAEYITTLAPTQTNEYTGIFKNYNLIYLTAEGFSTYAIHPELTPTLYRLVNSGFVFNNYYVPLWQTSTSDGEYVNCTGLIPDGQFSMRKSGENNMAFTLPKFFAREGVTSYAYHNNTLSYYDRHITHPNLGYIFKASRLGECSEAEYGQYIFSMENPGRWPSSDYEMMQGTVSEYINSERFHVYYMTISGHMYYSFSGNSMSSKNKEAVSDIDMSENARAYYACHIELDKALQYLIEQLEAAGKLENTVICLSADHYPYAMTEMQYEELAGKSLKADMDKFRNSLILWNVGIEEPIVVDKACCSVDIIPTLLNMFGFEYDSRMYAGRDVFSEEEGVVIFNDRSFVTDTVYYDKKAKTLTWKTELTPEQQNAYMDYMKEEVKRRYSFSAYILQEDYYQLIQDCMINS